MEQSFTIVMKFPLSVSFLGGTTTLFYYFSKLVLINFYFLHV